MSAPTSPDDLLKPCEVADLLRVDVKTVGRWAAEGRIPSVRTPGGHHRYRRADVEAANAPSLSRMIANALHSTALISFEDVGDTYKVTAADGKAAYAGYGDTLAEALSDAMRQLAAAREQAEAGA